MHYRFYPRKFILISVFGLMLWGACTQVQTAKADASADKALATFKKIMASPDHPTLVLDPGTDLAGLNLGKYEAVKVYYIRRQDINKLAISDTIIRYTNRLIYPIYSVQGKLVSSLEMELDNGVWTARRFGERVAITAYEKSLANTSLLGLSGTYLVRIPSLNMNFTGGVIGGKTNLMFLNNQAVISKSGDSISVIPPYPIGQLIPHLQNLEKDAGGLPM